MLNDKVRCYGQVFISSKYKLCSSFVRTKKYYKMFCCTNLKISKIVIVNPF